MAASRLALLTLGWWVGMTAGQGADLAADQTADQTAGQPPVVFPLDACPAGDPTNGPDGLHCSRLPVEFTTDGIYHMRQSSGEVVQVYCDMSGGRWNEILRRGVDAEKTPVAAASQLSFASNAASDGYQNLHGDLTSEFFVGIAQLDRFAPSGHRTELLVELETTDDEYYFSIFNMNNLNPINSARYVMGTGGNGYLTNLDGKPFNPTCPEAWFAASDCAEPTEPYPHLTRPMDGTVSNWPRVDKPLKRISMKVRLNKGEFCTFDSELALSFNPNTLETISVDVSMSPSITTPAVAGTSAMYTNITLTCRDSTKVITTKSQYAAKDYAALSSTMTFFCQPPSSGLESMFDDLPINAEAICMTPCPSDYTLVGPTSWTHTDDSGNIVRKTVNRLTCLSPVRTEAGVGRYKAAQLCGANGEQLLDFPVPRDRLADDVADGTSLITAMYYRKDTTDNVLKLRDLRGRFMPIHPFNSAAGGDLSAADRCVGLFVDAAAPDGMTTKQTQCYNAAHRFVCMTNVGCAPEQLWLDGFCYDILPSPLKDHMKTCYPDPKQDKATNGMPAVPSAGLLALMQAQDSPPTEPVVGIGVYRRADGFFAMDVPMPDGDIASVADTSLGCAVQDVGTGQLTAIACNDNTAPERSVICQYPGLPDKECPTNMRLRYSTSTETGNGDPNSHNQVANITARAGYNFYERKAMHSLEYKCIDLQSDWLLQTDINSLTNQDVSHWAPPEVLACDAAEDTSGYPANSNFSTADHYLVHACRYPLQTSAFETEQQQTCNHWTFLYEGAVTDCDECMLNPLQVHSDLALSSGWDSVTRALNTEVNFTCHDGLTTWDGFNVQPQLCTVDGWVGDVDRCDTCAWLPSFNASAGVLVNVSGGLQFGGLVEMQCAPGTETAAGDTLNTAVCTPDAWNVCHADFVCDHCTGPPLNHSTVAFVASSDWDDVTRVQGTVVTYTCEGSTVTASGTQLQYQNCTEFGWIGDVFECGVCPGDPANATSPTSREWDGSRTVGAQAWYLCPSGTATSAGQVAQNQTCTIDGWAGDVLPCDTCVGEPVNVTGMATITSSFTGAETQIGAALIYTCNAPLTTSGGNSTQTVTCTDSGWIGGVLPCDVCPPPPSGDDPTIAVTHPPTDGHRLGSSVTYNCGNGLYTQLGHQHITTACEAGGWTVCQPEIKCEYCHPLGDVSKYGGTLTWDYTGVNLLGTVVTLTCGAGLATPDLNTTQTLTCGLGGWNRAVPCSVCTDPAPTPPASMQPNVTWTLGDPTAIYTCLDTKQFAWGLTQFELTCSPTGWQCAPPCDYCKDTPPPPAGLFPTNVFNNPGGRAEYECNNRLQTALNQTSQSLTCGETGWQGELLPCDECIGDVAAAGPGQNRTWSGNSTVGTVIVYECLPGMETEEGVTYQTRNCTSQGWTPQPDPCKLCVEPEEAHRHMTREWAGNRTVNSTATYTCMGNLTTMANETEQTITCTETGWSSRVHSCAMCLDEIPDAGNYTERNVTAWHGWRYPGATVEYLCYTGAVQTAVCTGSGWEPAELPPCYLTRSLVQSSPPKETARLSSRKCLTKQREPWTR